jgi:carbonic anhydrase
VQDAWSRGQTVTVHGWVYDLKDGLVRDMGISIANLDELEHRYRAVLAKRYSESA